MSDYLYHCMTNGYMMVKLKERFNTFVRIAFVQYQIGTCIYKLSRALKQYKTTTLTIHEVYENKDKRGIPHRGPPIEQEHNRCNIRQICAQQLDSSLFYFNIKHMCRFFKDKIKKCKTL